MKLTSPPSDAAFAACVVWYRNLSDEHRELFCDAGLTPLTWWTVTPKYLAKTVACWESNLFGGRLDATAQCPTSPHFAFEFEWATVFGDMGAWGWALKKTYGKLLRVRSLAENDPLDEWCCLVVHNACSPWRQKWEQRDWMKDRLGTKYRKVVNFARKSTWQEFDNALNGGVHVFNRKFFDGDKMLVDLLHQMKVGTVTALRWQYPEKFHGEAIQVRCRNIVQPRAEYLGAAHRITKRIGVDLKTFWKACKGEIMLPSPRPLPTQRQFSFD